MKNLRMLGLILPHETEKGTLHIPSSLHSLQIRDLDIDRRRLYTLEKEPTTASEAAYQNLFTVLKKWAPLVEGLVVDMFKDLKHTMKYAQSLKYLRQFYLTASEDAPSGLGDMKLPTVESVGLFGPFSLLALGFFPSASKLIYDGRGDPDQPTNRLRIEVARWNALQVLTIEWDDFNWKDISLPHLRKITYTRPSSDTYRTNSALLEELVKNPTSFPSLSHMGLRCFPSWDALFIMLERRNFLPEISYPFTHSPACFTSTCISPITTLAFPILPSNTILEPLLECLRGKIANRPTNFELSLHALKDIYFDPQM
jgi:hypothetical protein